MEGHGPNTVAIRKASWLTLGSAITLLVALGCGNAIFAVESTTAASKVQQAKELLNGLESVLE